MKAPRDVQRVTLEISQKLKGLTIQEIEGRLAQILGNHNPTERLQCRQAAFMLAEEGFARIARKLERYVRDTMLFNQQVVNEGSEVERVCLCILEHGINHLLNQVQNEERSSDLLFNPGDTLFGYIKRVARHHNVGRDTRKRNTYTLYPSRAINEEADESGDLLIESSDDAVQGNQRSNRPYRAFASAVITPSADEDGEDKDIPEYMWGVTPFDLAEVEALRELDRLRDLKDDAAKIALVLSTLSVGNTLAEFDEVTRALNFISPRIVQPYRRRLKQLLPPRRGGALATFGVQEIAQVLDVSPPTARKWIREAERSVNAAQGA